MQPYTIVSMKVYIARHGRTNYNDRGLCNSDPTVDVHLTEAGILQAQALAQKMKRVALEKIYVSELKRTQQTAAYVNQFHDVPIYIDSRLNDNCTGFEGKRASEYYAAFKEVAEHRWTTRFNDGESIEDMNARVHSFIDELRTPQYEAVLVITSEIIVQAMYGVLHNLSNEEALALQVEQGSFIEFDMD